MSVLIIAEIGVNHNGDTKIAKKMINEAKLCGADVVKFQTFIASELALEISQKAIYQEVVNDKSKSQLDMLQKLELSCKSFIELKNYCDSIGIKFMTTAFDLISLEFIINELKVNVLKIPSGEINNIPYLEKCAATKMPIILSTGMCTMDDVEFNINLLQKNGNNNLTVLHCTTDYPANLEEVNLNAMVSMKEKFGHAVGYSDHTQGNEVAFAAVALGAQVIEKHFTLDKNMSGPDHKASADCKEFDNLVKGIRKIETAMGNGIKNVSFSEQKNIEVVRKSIVAAQNIRNGEIYSNYNLTTKRAGIGLDAKEWYDLIGKKAQQNFDKDEVIKHDK